MSRQRLYWGVLVAIIFSCKGSAGNGNDKVVDCELGPWSAWSACTDGDYRMRNRSVLTPAQCGGKACNDDRTELEKCCVPRDCQLSTWSTWSSCMFGELKRTRRVLKSEAKCGGISCSNYTLEEVKECPGGESVWLYIL